MTAPVPSRLPRSTTRGEQPTDGGGDGGREVEADDELDSVLSYIKTRTTLDHLVDYASARGLLAAPVAAAPDSGQRELIARRIIARHLRLAASAENVGDWPAYLRLCADGHDAGTSWLDHRQVAALLAEQPHEGPRETTVDQLTAKDFGLWVDVPERQTAGYLYVISDQYGDGYPSRVLTLVSGDSTTAPELEFTDADPASYPKTMRTPCLVLAEQPGGGK